MNLKVGPEDYVNMIESVKERAALIILMVDLLDFPCSIWPEMIELIGKNQQVVVVGNKVDLLPKDSKEYLQHIKTRLQDSIIDAGAVIKSSAYSNENNGLLKFQASQLRT